MSYTQKYCLVSFISPIDEGTEFKMSEWPLHITLADVFAIDRKSSTVIAQLAELLKKQPPITIRATKETVLGAIKVILVEKSNNLQALHTHIVDLLEANGAEFNTPEFTREGFVPHCTIQKAERLNAGDKCSVDAVALIDMLPHNNWQQRKVLSNFKLQGR